MSVEAVDIKESSSSSSSSGSGSYSNERHKQSRSIAEQTRHRLRACPKRPPGESNALSRPALASDLP